MGFTDVAPVGDGHNANTDVELMRLGLLQLLDNRLFDSADILVR